MALNLSRTKKQKSLRHQKAAEVMLRSWKRGVAVVTCGVSTLRIVPPLTIQTDMLAAALDIVEDTINEVAKET